LRENATSENDRYYRRKTGPDLYFQNFYWINQYAEANEGKQGSER
jgi:hypothetical protein